MKLHKLHIRQPRSRAMSNCETIAGGDNRIRRVTEHLTAPACREDRNVGNDLNGATGDTRANANALASLDDEVEDSRFLDDADAFTLVDAVDQRAGDFRAS